MGQVPFKDATKALLPTHPNTHFMLIDGMTKLMTDKVKKCQSSDFQVSGVKWCFLIHSRAQGKFTISLKLSDEMSLGSNWEVKCIFHLILVEKTGVPRKYGTIATTYKAKQEPKGGNFTIPEIVLRDRYIVEDKVVFGAEITGVQPSFRVTPVARTIGTSELIKLMEVTQEKSRFTWKITHFSSFNRKNHSSYEFTFEQRKWILVMYPKGTETVNGQYLSFFLCATDYTINDPKGTTMAVFKLKVLDQLNRNHYEIVQEGCFRYNRDPLLTSSGQDKFVSLEELHKASRGFLVNDEMYLSVEFLFVSVTENL